jgi:hypothetical protein
MPQPIRQDITLDRSTYVHTDARNQDASVSSNTVLGNGARGIRRLAKTPIVEAYWKAYLSG